MNTTIRANVSLLIAALRRGLYAKADANISAKSARKVQANNVVKERAQ